MLARVRLRAAALPFVTSCSYCFHAGAANVTSYFFIAPRCLLG
jgi:hypothetical protein